MKRALSCANTTGNESNCGFNEGHDADDDDDDADADADADADDDDNAYSWLPEGMMLAGCHWLDLVESRGELLW